MTSDPANDVHIPVEIMLAKWPLLYPEIAGAALENADDDAARVREEVVRPLLDTSDPVHAFEEARERYRSWKDSSATAEPYLETVVAREARLDDALAATFDEHEEVLGEQAVKGALEAVNLRRIVRESVTPYRVTWPEESWERISRLMTGSELCLAGILEHIATGEDGRENVETLARWGFQYALDAYRDAGYYGQNSTKLEDFPE